MEKQLYAEIQDRVEGSNENRDRMDHVVVIMSPIMMVAIAIIALVIYSSLSSQIRDLRKDLHDMEESIINGQREQSLATERLDQSYGSTQSVDIDPTPTHPTPTPEPTPTPKLEPTPTPTPTNPIPTPTPNPDPTPEADQKKDSSSAPQSSNMERNDDPGPGQKVSKDPAPNVNVTP